MLLLPLKTTEACDKIWNNNNYIYIDKEETKNYIVEAQRNKNVTDLYLKR